MLSFWIKDAFSLFYYYRTRFLFSLIGIMIGIGSICALSAVKAMVNENSKELLKKYGGARFVLTIMPMNAKEKKIAQTRLSSESVLAFCENQPDFQLVPYQLLNIKSTLNAKSLGALSVASTPDLFTLMQWPIAKGRTLHSLDKQDKVALVGAEVANHIQDALKIPHIIGSTINVGGHYFTIIGQLEAVELNPLLDFDANQSIFIDLNLLGRLKSEAFVDSFIVQGNHQSLAVSENALKERIKIELGMERLFFRDALIFQQALFKQVILTIKILALVAAITLCLGILSIVNLFIILMDERKKEMGLRLSLGATSSHLLWQLLRESMMLSILGGIGGIVFGQITAYIIVRKLEMAYYSEWSSWQMGVLCSLLIGLGTGIIPAKLAAKLHPVKLINS